MIRRSDPKERFTTIRNQIIEDKSLTWQGRMILIYLLSKPAHWKLRPEHLVSEGDLKIDTVYKELTKLKKAGYIVMERLPNGGVEYVVYDTPQSTSENIQSGSEPLLKNQGSEKIGSEKIGCIVNTETAVNLEKDSNLGAAEKDLLGQPEEKPKKSAREVIFDEAWEKYPKRQGGNSRTGAFKAFSARCNGGEKPETMLAGVVRYAKYITDKGDWGGPYVKQAATFFGPDKHYLELWALASAPASAPSSPPPSRPNGFDKGDLASYGL